MSHVHTSKFSKSGVSFSHFLNVPLVVSIYCRYIYTPKWQCCE